ncbi:dmX-like protein 2 [Montipora capricornis]|uniref:dmX-like protein 2 n=1 Tax=Montipora capricornis TaxID=246305 RepID=UPI0035F14522
MKLHQVLTGAANTFDDKAAIAVGSVDDHPFTAYASGCDVVILLSGFTRVQIISGSLYGYKEVSCIDCCDSDGKIAASYGKQVILFEARSASGSNNQGFPFHWENSAELCLNFKITCLSWNREGKRLLIGGDFIQLWSCEHHQQQRNELEKNVSWTCIWACKPSVPIHLLQFSPDGKYFSSVGKHDRLIKVWFDNNQVNPWYRNDEVESQGSGVLDYTFIYLAHPGPVTGFSWRKTSKYMPVSTVVNCLLTSCIDNVCRIWCETVKQCDRNDPISPSKQNSNKCLWHLREGQAKEEMSADPLLRYQLCSTLQFHVAAAVNALSDIPILSSLDSISSENHSSFVLHWLNNKEIQFTMAAESCLGAPVLALEVESMDISEDSSITDSEAEILVPSDDDVERFLKLSPVVNRKRDKHSHEKAKELRMSPSPRARTPLDYLKHLQEDTISAIEESNTYAVVVSSCIVNLLHDWFNSPDTLLAVHPVDGSLLVWLVEWLDVQNGVPYRQPQVSFLSRIPSVLTPADANSLLNKLMVYCPREDKVRALKDVLINKGDLISPGCRKQPKPSSMALNISRSSFSGMSGGTHPTAMMISTHRDGALNLWQLAFADNSAFSTIVSVSHHLRRCGHRYPITNILAHPELPLMLSTSSHEIEGKSDTDFFSLPDDLKGKSRKVHSNELIVWKVESVSPLRQSGGVMELTRVNSSRPNAFMNIAWVPTLFSHSLISFDSSASIPPHAVAPCACFLALDGNSYRFYQVILDARTLQGCISSVKSRTRSTLYSSGSEESLNSLDFESPSSSVPIESFIESIVSKQSGATPGCILKLCSLVDSKDILREPLLLHVFTENSVKSLSYFENEKHDREHDENHSHSVNKSENSFYVVGLENFADNIDGGESVVSMIYMWKVTVTATKPETNIRGPDLEVISSYPEFAQPISRSSSSASNRSVSPLNLPHLDHVSSSIVSRNVCTQRLQLPQGVTVVTATRAADKMSSSAVNPTCPAQYLFTTSCSDGKVRFWSCREIESETQFAWEETSWLRSHHKYSGRGQTTEDSTLGLDAPGEVLSLSCAYTGRIATLCASNSVKEKDSADLSVCIWENESSGGMKWVLEDDFKLDCKFAPDSSQIRLEWTSSEDGSHILTVCICSELFILARASTIANTSVRGESSTIGKETWLLLHSIHLTSENKWQLLTRALSWIRNGVLVVGLGTEMQVYSQWRAVTDGTLSPSDTMTFAPTATLKKVIEASRVGGAGKVVALSMTPEAGIGLFEGAAAISPVLPQFHPKHLMELMNFGKLRRVRAILHHLVYCVAGREAMEAAASKALDHTTHSGRPRLSSMSSMKSIGSESDFKGLEADDKDKALFVPPLPLYALLAADKDTSGSGSATAADPAESNQGISTDETDYSSLFEPSRFSTSFESDDEDKSRTKTSPTHVAQAGSPVHFGLAQARLLSYQLTRKPLPGLTSTEQLELQALADTFASAKLDLEESPGSIERGVKFAKKEDESYPTIGGLMGGPGGGGGGYATTGSIGATAGSGGDAVDECGLRFLLAMRHHTCLMRSLPPKHRAILEEKGLSSSYYGWAFHSESEEELLAMVPPVLRGEATWSELRKYGIGWWVRSNDTLRRLIEKTAKAQFSKKQDPIDCALFYLAMKKKNVICGLYRTVRDSKMSQFFARNFSEDRWRKAALKNAYSLLGKQRFDHAAAFFLLAGSLWDAIQVCIGRLHDFQLAMVLARLYEEDTSGGQLYTRILKECLLGQGQNARDPIQDPFLRSIAYWIMKDYDQALETLMFEPNKGDNQERKCNKLAARGNPDIFNFYLYLRKHPLIKRRRYMHEHDSKNKMKASSRNVAPRQGSVREEEIIDEPLSPMERQLFFKTAHAHLNSGCPALALQVLMELPPTDIAERENDKCHESEPAVQESSGVVDDVTGNMINTGTLNDFSFGGTYPENCINGTAEEFDWSKPVSSNLSGDSSSDFDWSKPISSKLNGNSSSDFDWSMPVSSKLGDDSSADFDWSQPLASDLSGQASDDFDWSKPVSAEIGGGGLGNVSNGFDWSEPVSTKLGGTGLVSVSGLDSDDFDKDANGEAENVENSAEIANDEDAVVTVFKSKETRHLDVVAQQMKFSAMIKLLINELHGLPFSCVIADEDLRSYFLKWLEKELEILHKMTDYGSVAQESDDEEDGTAEVNIDPDEVQQDGSTVDKNYIALKIDRSAKHIQWLKKNQKLLTILLNYCSLHGASGGDLAAMNMELLLLLHEIEHMRFLVSPLYVPSAGPSVPPLILASVSQYSFLASPLGFLQSLTQDILKFIFSLPGPPSPNQPIRLGSVLHNLSGTLSDCIYQSLTGMSQEKAPLAGRRGSDSKRESSTVPSDKSDNKSGAGTTATPSSCPSKWPGVRLLLSLLGTENKDNSTKLRILLGEACVAVYLSLLALAWSNSEPKQLYRLVVNSLKSNLWGLVFGGGLRTAVHQSTGSGLDTKKKQPQTTTAGNTGRRGRGQVGDKYWQGARQRWNFKLLGQSLTETMSQWLTSDIKPVYVEQFVPPRTTLMEYFICKRAGTEDKGTKHYDSGDDDSEYEDPSESEAESDHEYFSSKRKKREPRDHLDYESYSWCLMNYTISKLVLHNMQTFLPDVGFELTDLPSLSPQLHAALKMIERWTQSFHEKLEGLQGPPPNFISQFPVSQDGFPRGGRALMRYKALMDPQNTPFRSTRHSAEPVKRLWRTLVHQEAVQDIFIHNIFKKEMTAVAESDRVDAVVDAKPVKILYKDAEDINSFCINKANPNFIAVGSVKDVDEVDISRFMSPEPMMWTEDENEREQNERSDEPDFTQSGNTSPQKTSPSGHSHYSGKVHLRRTVQGVKRMDSHPHLPYYVSGSQDGSIRMWEFGHAQEITSHHTSGSYQRVTRARFSPHGNKFGVSDASGQLQLWQVSSTNASSDAFLTLKCHNKQTSDFAFVGSSSFIATSGHSSDGSNVCLWDTLVSPHSSLVHAFICHESGAPCLAYVPGQQLVISGGRKGNICIFDLRQRQLRHTFLAHDAPVKSIVVDENEEFFISGSEDGDIKVWGLSVHEELECYPKEHGKGAYLLKYGTQGVAMMCLQPNGQLFSCGGDGTVKWRQLSVRETIFNSKLL